MLKNIDKFLKNYRRKSKLIRHPKLNKTVLIENKDIRIIKASRNACISLDGDISYKNIIYKAKRGDLKRNTHRSMKRFRNRRMEEPNTYEESFSDILNFYSNIDLEEKKINCDISVDRFPQCKFSHDDLNNFNDLLVTRQISAYDKNIENRYLRIDCIRKIYNYNYDYMFERENRVIDNIISTDRGNIRVADGALFYNIFNGMVIIAYKDFRREIYKIF